MVINAYKIDVQTDGKQVKSDKSDRQIIKEITDMLITEDMKLILDEDLNGILGKVTTSLYNIYHLKSEKQIQLLKEEIIHKIFGYGILQKYINDLNISDIRVVTYNEIYVKERGRWKKVKEKFESKQELEEYVRFCALKNNCNINFDTPVLVFSDKKNSLRIEAGLEPANVIGPSLVIRIHRDTIPANIERLFVEYNMLDKKSYKILKDNIKPLQNVILCGKGGSGKTTLLKALIERIPKEMAITTNEETAELYLKDRNVIQRECILNRSESKNIDLELLSKQALVMSNDIIIIGELKGAEANSFFDSISTGHTGLATVHADSARNVVDRLITLIKKDIKAQYYTEAFLRRFLSSSIDYVIFLKDFKVVEIMKISYNEMTTQISYEFLYNMEESE